MSADYKSWNDVAELAQRDSARVNNNRLKLLKNEYKILYWWNLAEKGDQIKCIANMWLYRESLIGRAAAKMLLALMI